MFIKNPMNSPAGYIGALVAIFLSFTLAEYKSFFGQTIVLSLFIIVLAVFISMLLVEIPYQLKTKGIELSAYSYKTSKIKSAFWRFFTLLCTFLIYYSVIQFIYFAGVTKLGNFILFLNYILLAYLIFGFPYVYFTISKMGSVKYEFIDYAILSMILFRSLSKNFSSDELIRQRAKSFLSNRRMNKIFLAYVVSGFFSALMCGFVTVNFENFSKALALFSSAGFQDLADSKQIMVYFQIFYWLIFLVDTCIGLIGYNVASRWLNNRTKSVDSTFYGWWAALACYPPVNTLISSFIPSVSDPAFTLSDYTLVYLMFAITAMYTLYVWGTITLGFRFSNLTNRGIVTSGPYSIVRHPAYFAKNIAWWLETPQLFAHPILIVGLIFWNIVYFFRAVTEEVHLKQDEKYAEYCEKVKYRFIPGLF